MPKQADIRVQVPSCTAARFWDVVYEKPEATERYHTSFNASTATSVTPWSSCQRTINFTMPLRLPDFIKRMVGLDCVAVTELQRVVWHGGGSFTVTSETHITNLMGAGRFTTALKLTATEVPEKPTAASAAPAPTAASGLTDNSSTHAPACPSNAPVLELVYSVRCAASSMPWPMSATIENLMAEKALVSMQTFLDLSMELLDEDAAAAAAGGTKTEPAALAAAANGAAVLEPEASLPSGGLTPPPLAASAASASGGGPGGTTAAPLSPPLAQYKSGPSLRHRWPSITCSHDIGVGVGVSVSAGSGGEAFLLRRQDTLGGGAGGGGGGDVFWDAPETFAGGASGVSSGGISPRQHLSALHSSGLRRLSGDAGAAPGALGGAGAATAAVGAVACETHQVAVAVDRLADSVTSLDRKVDKMLLLQQQHLERQQQQLERQERQLQQLLSDRAPGLWRGGSSAASGGDRRDGRRDIDSGAAADARWLLRVAVAVLLATLGLMVLWVLYPHATGYRPHGDGGGGGGAPSPLPQASVVRIEGGIGAGLGADVNLGATGPVGGAHGGRMIGAGEGPGYYGAAGGSGETAGALGATAKSRRQARRLLARGGGGRSKGGRVTGGDVAAGGRWR